MAAIVAPAPRPGRCVLTGSQKPLVSAAVGQSLAGRAARIGLDEWIVAGAYPALYDRDVRQISRIVDLLRFQRFQRFQRFMRAMAARIGQLPNLGAAPGNAERDGVMTAHWRDALLALRGA